MKSGTKFKRTSKENWWRTCEYCEKKFHVPPSDVKRGWCRFCSKKCCSSWRKGRPTLNWNEKSRPNKGKEHHNWKGGSYRKRMDQDQVDWSRRIKERDNFTCRMCSERGGKLNSHHLFFWSSYPELRNDDRNGVTLCVACHKFVHSICRDYTKEKV